MNSLAQRRKGERGSVLAMSAISMLALLLATGLAVDVSHFYTAKVELQNAADAAALAAASQLNSTSGGIKCAINEATKTLNKYDFKTSVTIVSANITFATNLNGSYMDSASAIASPTNIRFVKVAIPPKPVGVTFAAIALGPTQTIPASATAGMSIGLTMNKFYTAYTFIESPAAPIVKGAVLTLNAKAYNDPAPTSYRVLAGPDGDLVLTGPIHAYGYIGSSYNIATLSAAEMCRYAKIGTNTRFGDYSPTNVHPSVNPIDEPPDTITQENISYRQYTDMQGNGTVQNSGGMKNRRIMTVPIASNTSYNVSSKTVTSNRLAAFFIRKKMATVPTTANCNLEVEYIGAPLVVPEGTYAPGGTAMSELTIPVLYK
ncbi:MAG TPA: pilus assembly protein TadG-related protein [Pyrinomonadaceae bacterium]|jgi:Flp pilus assembly protein TadG|nr:pilus assembly protein TadG-related protein [Pyrinomonadaceae bacterium]